MRNGVGRRFTGRPGRVTALVSGSTMYDVKVTVGPVRDPTGVPSARTAAGISTPRRVLQEGRFSKGVMAASAQQKAGEFPSPKDIIFT